LAKIISEENGGRGKNSGQLNQDEVCDWGPWGAQSCGVWKREEGGKGSFFQ